MAYLATRQPFFGGLEDAPTAAATEYASIFGGNSSNTWATTEIWRQSLFPIAGNLRKLKIRIGTAPGAGTSVTFTIMKNGSATAMAVTISDTNTEGEYSSADLSIAAGDRISIRCTQTNSPTLFTTASWSFMFEPTAVKRFVMIGGTGNGTGDVLTTEYQPASGGYTWTTTNTQRQSLVAVDGTIRSWTMRMNARPASGATMTYYIYKNGAQEASSAIAFTSASNVLQTVSGLSIDIAPGDILSIGCVSQDVVSTARYGSWGLEIEPDNDGESQFCGARMGPGNTATSYGYPTNQSALAGDATEADRTVEAGVVERFTISDFRGEVSTAPGSGKSWALTVRKNSGAGNSTFTIADTATSNVDSSNTDVFEYGDDMSIQLVPSGTPTTSGIRMVWAAKVTMDWQEIPVTKSLQYAVKSTPPYPRRIRTADDTFYGSAFSAGPNKYSTTLAFGGWGDFYYDYFKFPMPSGITSSDITQAKLWVYVAGSPTNDCAAHVRRLTSDWDGATLTRTNLPTENSTNYGNLPALNGGTGWREVDITTLVHGWLDGTFTNYGLKVHPTTNNEANGSFASDEDASGNYPYIELIGRGAITKSLKYTVETTPAALTKSLKYTVTTEHAPITKSLQYAVLTEQGITKMLKYAVLTEGLIQLGLQYEVQTAVPVSIEKQLRYAVRTIGALTKSLQYLVKAEVPVTKSLKYTVHTTPAPIERQLKYAVVLDQVLTKALAYFVRTEQSLTKSLKYTVVTEQSVTKSLSYRVRVEQAITKSLRYAVRTVGAITKGLVYAVRTVHPVTKSLQYAVKTENAQTKSLKYTVETTSAITRSLKYGVLTTEIITRALAYFVRRNPSVTKELKYTVKAPHSVTLELTYIVKRIYQEGEAVLTTKGDPIVINKSKPEIVPLATKQSKEVLKLKQEDRVVLGTRRQ